MLQFSDNSLKASRHVNRWDYCFINNSWGQSNCVPEVDMDNAYHTVSHTELLHIPLSDFRWDWTLTFIHNIFIFLGAAAKRGDPNLTWQLCLGKEPIYQKWGVIYAVLSGCVVSSATGLFCNCSQRSITASKTDTQSKASAISASTAGETIRHSWVFASSPLFRKDWTA